MSADNLHPYVTASLTVLWLPDTLTAQVPAVLDATNRPAYRLTPATYAALHANVDQLEARWTASPEGLTAERRAAIEQAAGVLTELWDWLLARSGTGTVATEPAALPDVKRLVRECQQVDRSVPLEEWNPTIPIPQWTESASKAVAAGESPTVEVAQRAQRRRKPPGRSKAKAGKADSIATGRPEDRPQSAGMFDGL